MSEAKDHSVSKLGSRVDRGAHHGSLLVCCPAQNEMVKRFRVVIASFDAGDKGSCG